MIYKVAIQGIVELAIDAEDKKEAEMLAKMKIQNETSMKAVKVMDTHKFYDCDCSECLLLGRLGRL